MLNLGNFDAGQTICLKFSTNDSSGAAVAPSTPGTVSVYKDGGATESTAGVTCTVSFDGLIGVNHVEIVTADAFYAAGHDYQVVLSGAVIDGNAVNCALACFSIGNRSPSANQNADALLDRADGVETGKTLRQAVQIVAAVLAGKVSGAGSGVERFTGIDGSSPRVEVAADAAGNRTAVTYDP